MEFRVLGPLAVVQHGTEATPSATKQRQMLALLLLTSGHLVPVDQFIEELWDGNPTPTAIASVHTYIMQLRRMLSDLPGNGRTAGSAGQRLITLDRAYQLDVRPGELDLDEFTSKVHSGRAKLSRNEFRSAALVLRDALDLWRGGPALPDVVTGPLLYPAVRALEATRLEVLGQRVWAELRLGQHHELVGELSSLNCQHPTNEVFATQLMLALHRSGRRAEALDVFHRHRAALREELGLTPPPQLHELYTDILRSHPRLETPAGSLGTLSLDVVADLAS
jgi:SARP family transcriptional regulator, regulator of embCAB operon